MNSSSVVSTVDFHKRLSPVGDGGHPLDDEGAYFP